jgi:hypothetical protein
VEARVGAQNHQQRPTDGPRCAVRCGRGENMGRAGGKPSGPNCVAAARLGSNSFSVLFSFISLFSLFPIFIFNSDLNSNIVPNYLQIILGY